MCIRDRALAAWAVVPFGPDVALANVNAGLLFLMAITSLEVYGVIIAGWASNSKYAFLGALRASAQMVSYEIAMGFCLVVVLMAAGSMNLSEIVASQGRGSFADLGVGVLIAFIGSAVVLSQVAGGARFNGTVYEWMTAGKLVMEIGFLVDGLTAMMMVVVTFVSLMVHVYTIGYMEGDPGYQRFFSYISLFTFSMLMLVMSNNFLSLIHI